MTPIPSVCLLRWEIALVVLLSLGKSGIYAVVRLAERYYHDAADVTVTLNQAQAPTAVFDLIYQLLGVFFALLPVALVILLFKNQQRSFLREAGMFNATVKDWVHGVGLFFLIGVGTVGVYQASRQLGISPVVEYAAGTMYPHEIAVLVLRSFENGLLEELIVVAYLAIRVRDITGVTPGWKFLVATSLLRASYHLYQGIGAGIGNFLMGLIFGAYFLKRWRVLPLVIAHVLLDLVGFLAFRFFGPFLGLGS